MRISLISTRASASSSSSLPAHTGSLHSPLLHLSCYFPYISAVWITALTVKRPQSNDVSSCGFFTVGPCCTYRCNYLQDDTLFMWREPPPDWFTPPLCWTVWVFGNKPCGLYMLLPIQTDETLIIQGLCALWAEKGKSKSFLAPQKCSFWVRKSWRKRDEKKEMLRFLLGVRMWINTISRHGVKITPIEASCVSFNIFRILWSFHLQEGRKSGDLIAMVTIINTWLCGEMVTVWQQSLFVGFRSQGGLK